MTHFLTFNMRAVIQRVSEAEVVVNFKSVGRIKNGLLILLGIEDSDTTKDIVWLAQKIVNMRIFSNEAGLMNKSVKDLGGNILLVSQFTLFAQTQKGNRPSFIKASKPEKAIPLYEQTIQVLEENLGKKIATGIFGADMKIRLINDGPATIIMDTKDKENH
jgi:D-tyrosyl-tRNA(Tyr) deacylase